MNWRNKKKDAGKIKRPAAPPSSRKRQHTAISIDDDSSAESRRTYSWQARQVITIDSSAEKEPRRRASDTVLGRIPNVNDNHSIGRHEARKLSRLSTASSGAFRKEVGDDLGGEPSSKKLCRSYSISDFIPNVSLGSIFQFDRLFGKKAPKTTLSLFGSSKKASSDSLGVPIKSSVAADGSAAGDSQGTFDSVGKVSDHILEASATNLSRKFAIGLKQATTDFQTTVPTNSDKPAGSIFKVDPCFDRKPEVLSSSKKSLVGVIQFQNIVDVKPKVEKESSPIKSAGSHFDSTKSTRRKLIETRRNQLLSSSDEDDSDEGWATQSYNPMSSKYSGRRCKRDDSKPPYNKYGDENDCKLPARVTPIHDSEVNVALPRNSPPGRLADTTVSVACLPRKVTSTYDCVPPDTTSSFQPPQLHTRRNVIHLEPSHDDRKPKAREIVIELSDSDDESAHSKSVSPTPRTELPAEYIFDLAMSSSDEEEVARRQVKFRQSHTPTAPSVVSSNVPLRPNVVPSCIFSNAAIMSSDDEEQVSKQPIDVKVDQRQPEVVLHHDDGLISEDSSDDDNVVTVRGRRRTRDEVRADIEEHIDEDSDDEDFEAPLTEQHKIDALASIKNLEDKAYQVLLWKEGFRMTLLAHQFLGSRAVAGLPENFPFHAERLDDPNEATMARAVRTLPKSKTRGLLLADDMGLGKTIQAISGSVMRTAVAVATNQPTRPTLIISPNVALIEQWMLELKKNGVKSRHILYIQKRQKIGTKGGFRHHYIFMTRYTLATETKDILHESAVAVNPQRTQSSLYPDYTKNFYAKMWRLKRGSDGHTTNNPRNERETFDDCLTRLVKLNLARRPKTPVFGLVIIDEAHFLKNRVSFWGIGAAMLGVHAERAITMTGTPYCNNSSDVAALQSYIDITHEAAKTKWWEKATGEKATHETIQDVSNWRDQYLIRRRKEVVLKDILKNKFIIETQVRCYPRELQVYDLIESKLIKMMEQFAKKATHPRKERELQDIMMALMTLARGCLVHPMIPNGREITKMFSPSRRHIPSKIPKICVYCNQLFRATIPLAKTVDDDENDDDDDVEVTNGGPGIGLDLEDSDLDDDDDVIIETGRNKKKKLGKLIRFPPEFCGWAARDEEQSHFIHEKCLALFHDGNETRCSRCVDLENRVNLQTSLGKPLVPHKRYCTHIQPLPDLPGGFVASSKIEKVLKEFAKIPKGEKTIILSFFKGSLDLLEGIFVEEMGIDCARYDGDMNHADRKVELDRFKDKSKSCRVLLSTVHVCGTGLNIVEANHVFFVDRWFNPTVHDQAMDRCYRIGQKKDVFVNFFDCVETIDIGMMLTNKNKKTNSAILLADGTELGDGNMTFRQLQGVMRNLIAEQQKKRILHAAVNGLQAPFERVDSTMMADLMARVARMAEATRNGRRPRRNEDDSD